MQCGLDDAWGRQRLSGYGGSWVCIGVLGKGMVVVSGLVAWVRRL